MLLLACTALSFSQQSDGQNIPNTVFTRIDRKAGHIDRQLTRQTEKYLRRFSRQEAAMQRAFYQTDPNAANKVFSGRPGSNYQALSKDLHADKTMPLNVQDNGNQYLPYVDSLQGTLNFLHNNPQLIPAKAQPAAVQQSLTDLRALRYKLQNADQVNQYVRQRQQELRASIDQCVNNSALKKCYDDYRRTAYYYGEQINEYKNTLNDPDKLVQETLTVLNKLPAFRDFMVKNSLIARLFNVPVNDGSSQTLQGLQTRDQVQGLIQEQISAGGPNATAQLQNSLASAHTQLDKLKDKLGNAGGSGGDMDMPDFTPNRQKTRSLLQRLEYGCNFQTSRSDHFYPTTTDLGLSVGYRLNDKSTVGVGASYKLGWGRGIDDLHFTSEGMGLRSFLDIRIKGNWFASGGYEYNYQASASLSGQLPARSTWTRSGLIGVSKMLSQRGKYIKKTRLQLLWDLLSYSQRPQTQAIKFRIGYNF